MSNYKAAKIKKRENIATTIKSMSIAIAIFFAFAIFFSSLGITTYNEYQYYKINAVPVTAEITQIEEEDNEGTTDYKMYVSYEYNDTVVTNNHWKTLGNNHAPLGSEITIKIDPDNPVFIFKEDDGLTFFVLALAFLAIMYCVFTEMIRKKSKSKLGEKNILTDKMLANDLKPRFLVYLSKLMVFFFFGLTLGSFVMPEAFGTDTRITGFVFLVLSMLVIYFAFKQIASMPKKQYKMNINKCIRKWSEGSGEDETFYTTFDKFGTVKENHGILGNRYYIIEDHNGFLRQIYDVTHWYPQIEDPSLTYGSKSLTSALTTELLAGIVLVIIYFIIVGVFI